MFTFRTILFAADFSESSKSAFHVATALAAETRTRLFVLHVLEPPIDVTEMGLAFPSPTFSEADRESCREDLREAYTPNHPVDVEYLVRNGLAPDEILAVATELKADLIVTGTHGRRGLGRLLAGSVAESVMRHAACPVLALRTPSAEAPIELSGERPILHPTDLSDNSAPALWVARALCRERGTPLVLLHVSPPPLAMEGYVEGAAETEAGREDLEAIAQSLEGSDLKFPVEIRIAEGDPGQEIAQVARDVDAQLIVMGSHGRTGLGRLLMGSVAEATMRRADCPVLMIKRPVPAAAPGLVANDRRENGVSPAVG